MKKLFLLVTGAAFAIALTALAPVAALADSHSTSGTFEGASTHVTTGGVSIVTTSAGRTLVILDDDFSLDNGPDPRVGFGNDGAYDPETELGALVSLAGLQVYVVPATVNPAAFNEVYIWCKVAGVPLGIAALK
ncbi:MAG: DM13 domain-containing protein [Paracoccaceae bacterium]